MNDDMKDLIKVWVGGLFLSAWFAAAAFLLVGFFG